MFCSWMKPLMTKFPGGRFMSSMLGLKNDWTLLLVPKADQLLRRIFCQSMVVWDGWILIMGMCLLHILTRHLSWRKENQTLLCCLESWITVMMKWRMRCSVNSARSGFVTWQLRILVHNTVASWGWYGVYENGEIPEIGDVIIGNDNDNVGMNCS